MSERPNCRIRTVVNNSLGKGWAIQVYPYPERYYYGFSRKGALTRYRKDINMQRKRFNYV